MDNQAYLSSRCIDYFVGYIMQHLILFPQDFLKKEFSEENVEFWKVCEDYRNIIDSNFVSLASLQENLSLRFPTRSDTNRAVQPQKMDRGLKFRI